MTASSSTTCTLPQIKPTELVGFHKALAKWYGAHGRHTLPWRNTTDPYHIWVSEVMLQQTQVATVLARFYHPFLERFPTVDVLAKAPREAVMKAWEGLGYYRRAGNMHEAAKIWIADGGITPNPPPLRGSRRLASPLSTSLRVGATQPTLEALLALPGIGQNTAHAILAFAYHQPVPILEANVKRVVARIFALETPNEKQLWAGAEILLNHKEPFDYNQAMMDLGAMICTPKAPKCGECPANKICQGKAAPELYPTPKVKKKVPTRHVIITVPMDAQGRIRLERRDDALLGGLWGFNQVSGSKFQAPGTKLTQTRNPKPETCLGHITHIYTHFRLEAEVYLMRHATKQQGNSWFTREEIAALPLSRLDHKVLTLLDTCNSSPPNTLHPHRGAQRA